MAYHVAVSGVMAARIRRLQRQAKRQGRGEAFLASIQEVYQQLRDDPADLGEPNYRLSRLGLEIRTCVVPPLAVDFAVHLDKPIVFLKGVRLLSE
jgi:hypothetical protein